MATKKIQAKNMREGLALIRQSFGDDAVILSNKETSAGVEFIVTDEFHEHNKLQFAKDKNSSIGREDGLIIDLQTPGESAINALKFEMLALKNLLQEQLGELAWENKKRVNPIQALIIRRLIHLGFSALVASRIAAGLEQDLVDCDVWKAVKSHIIKALPGNDINLAEKNSIYAYLGSSGVGKTTVIAKMAAQHALKYGAQSVAIVSCDNDKIGAAETLKIYANILNIPVRLVENVVQMRDALNDFKKKQIILIDTPSINPSNPEQLQALAARFPAECYVHKLLVIPANMQFADLEKNIEFFQTMNISGSVLTKSDEAISTGAALSLAISQQLPINYVCNGQKVPDDIHIFSPSHFVNSVLNIRLNADEDEVNVARSIADVKNYQV